MLQGNDVYPALVVAGDQIPPAVVQLLQAFYFPAGIAGQGHPPAVAEYPEFRNADHDYRAAFLQRGNRQKLDQRQQK